MKVDLEWAPRDDVCVAMAPAAMRPPLPLDVFIVGKKRSSRWVLPRGGFLTTDQVEEEMVS